MKRVVFNFDEQSLKRLQSIAKDLNYKSPAGVVGDAVAVFDAIAKTHKQGFTELVVRNPNTNKEREIILGGETKFHLASQS